MQISISKHHHEDFLDNEAEIDALLWKRYESLLVAGDYLANQNNAFKPVFPNMPAVLPPLLLKRLKLINFKCFYGAYEFNLNKPLTVVYGSNGQGKSSLLQAILFALFGENFSSIGRGSPDDLISFGENFMAVELEFQIQEHNFMIERQRQIIKKYSRVSLDPDQPQEFSEVVAPQAFYENKDPKVIPLFSKTQYFGTLPKNPENNLRTSPNSKGISKVVLYQDGQYLAGSQKELQNYLNQILGDYQTFKEFQGLARLEHPAEIFSPKALIRLIERCSYSPPWEKLAQLANRQKIELQEKINQLEILIGAEAPLSQGSNSESLETLKSKIQAVKRKIRELKNHFPDAEQTVCQSQNEPLSSQYLQDDTFQSSAVAPQAYIDIHQAQQLLKTYKNSLQKIQKLRKEAVAPQVYLKTIRSNYEEIENLELMLNLKNKIKLVKESLLEQHRKVESFKLPKKCSECSYQEELLKSLQAERDLFQTVAPLPTETKKELIQQLHQLKYQYQELKAKYPDLDLEQRILELKEGGASSTGLKGWLDKTDLLKEFTNPDSISSYSCAATVSDPHITRKIQILTEKINYLQSFLNKVKPNQAKSAANDIYEQSLDSSTAVKGSVISLADNQEEEFLQNSNSAAIGNPLLEELYIQLGRLQERYLTCKQQISLKMKWESQLETLKKELNCISILTEALKPCQMPLMFLKESAKSIGKLMNQVLDKFHKAGLLAVAKEVASAFKVAIILQKSAKGSNEILPTLEIKLISAIKEFQRTNQKNKNSYPKNKPIFKKISLSESSNSEKLVIYLALRIALFSSGSTVTNGSTGANCPPLLLLDNLEAFDFFGQLKLLEILRAEVLLFSPPNPCSASQILICINAKYEESSCISDVSRDSIAINNSYLMKILNACAATVIDLDNTEFYSICENKLSTYIREPFA